MDYSTSKAREWDEGKVIRGCEGSRERGKMKAKKVGVKLTEGGEGENN